MAVPAWPWDCSLGTGGSDSRKLKQTVLEHLVMLVGHRRLWVTQEGLGKWKDRRRRF